MIIGVEFLYSTYTKYDFSFSVLKFRAVHRGILVLNEQFLMKLPNN